MELKISNDGLYIATQEDNEGRSHLISLEDLIYQFIETKKNDSSAVAITDLSNINNWFFNYQIDLGDAIDQHKQESLLDKIKELRNEIYKGEKEFAATNIDSGEFSYLKETSNWHQAIRIKLENMINEYEFWSEIRPIEGGKMDS